MQMDKNEAKDAEGKTIRKGTRSKQQPDGQTAYYNCPIAK